MRNSFRTATRRILVSISCGAACLFLISCPEPPSKPIPPLDPSKVIAEKDIPISSPAPGASAKPGRLTAIPLGDLYQLVQNNAVLIYDVRPLLIYKLGHIPGAISWPKNDFDRYYDKQVGSIRAANASNTPVVIYCTDFACPDGLTVATALSKRGLSVSVLQGGYEAWKIAAQ